MLLHMYSFPTSPTRYRCVRFAEIPDTTFGVIIADPDKVYAWTQGVPENATNHAMMFGRPVVLDAAMNLSVMVGQNSWGYAAWSLQLPLLKNGRYTAPPVLPPDFRHVWCAYFADRDQAEHAARTLLRMAHPNNA